MSISRAAPWLALLALHLLLSLQIPWASGGVFGTVALPSVDLVWLLASGLCLHLIGLRGRATHYTLGLATLYCLLYRAGESIVEVAWDRPFNLFADLREVPGLIHLFAQERSQWVVVPIVAFLVITVVLLGCLGFAAVWRPLLGRLGGGRSAWVGLGLCQVFALGALLTGSHLPDDPARWLQRSALASTYEDLLDHLMAGRREQRIRDEMAVARREQARLPAGVQALGGADVFVFFVESYGRLATAWDGGAPVREWEREFLPQLREAGIEVVSAYTESPVSGGGSALAHAELATGVRVATRQAFDLIEEGGLRPLPRVFHDAGYATLNVQPAMPVDWSGSERVFGYSEDWFHDRFPYRGRRYHFGRMPDQWALAYLLGERLRQPGPVFAQYVSVVSHYPFSLVPRYVADWERALDLTNYLDPAAQFDLSLADFMDSEDVPRAYRAVIEYSLRCSFGFAQELERPFLMLVLGDHQPPAFRGSAAVDNSRDVPLHVLSNRSELLQPFRDDGFVPGLVPDPERESLTMAEMHDRLRRYFGG